MTPLLTRYRQLLEQVDGWFAACLNHFPGEIACTTGCSGCCRGLFEISLLDARLLQEGFQTLPASTRNTVLGKANRRRDELQRLWPEFHSPWILNHLPHTDWLAMPEDDPTPCPLLGDDGTCLVYRWRPMTCRLHGLPHIDLSGEIFADDWCTLNFPDRNPCDLPELRLPFRRLFEAEFDLLGEFAAGICGRPLLELDTFIPTALLIDFSSLIIEP